MNKIHFKVLVVVYVAVTGSNLGASLDLNILIYFLI